MRVLKDLERFVRKIFFATLSFLLQVKKRPVVLNKSPRILVVRLDERVGNLLLLTPLLASLKKHFQHIDVLSSVKAEILLSNHPSVQNVLTFRKKALFASDGPFKTLQRLRQTKYDLIIDAGNPTDPSVTQALLVRFAKAQHTIGSAYGAFHKLYSSPVVIDTHQHEIDLRLQLLKPLNLASYQRTLQLGELPVPKDIEQWLKKQPFKQFVVVNIGARLTEKQLTAEDYRHLILFYPQKVVVTYGPKELSLAKQAIQHTSAILAPPTDLLALAYLFKNASHVVTCDTGPMHLAVALQTPTCEIFVSTDPLRYGYDYAPHQIIDARLTNIKHLLHTYKDPLQNF